MCLFTQMIKHPIELPVAHGEGQFVLAQPDHLKDLQKKGRWRSSMRHRRKRAIHIIRMALIGNIAGVCNEQGNVLGLMPHPERYVSFLQHPQRKGATNGDGDGLLLFKNAYQYAKTMNLASCPVQLRNGSAQ